MKDRLFDIIRGHCKFEHCTGKKDLNVCKQTCADAQHLVDALIRANALVFPVKPGDAVYAVVGGIIEEWKVTFAGVNSLGEFKFIATNEGYKNTFEFWDNSIGVFVFLNEEDAITELKERKSYENT